MEMLLNKYYFKSIFFYVSAAKKKFVFSLNPNQREDLIWRAVIVIQ
jgi:hypothetical protein